VSRAEASTGITSFKSNRIIMPVTKYYWGYGIGDEIGGVYGMYMRDEM